LQAELPPVKITEPKTPYHAPLQVRHPELSVLRTCDADVACTQGNPAELESLSLDAVDSPLAGQVRLAGWQASFLGNMCVAGQFSWQHVWSCWPQHHHANDDEKEAFEANRKRHYMKVAEPGTTR
jgi:hypothetical protein